MLLLKLCRDDHDWFGSFVRINLCRLFNAKEEQYWCYLTHSWEDKGVHTFPNGICPKVNIITRLEFELAYCDSAVHRFNHYTTRTSPGRNCFLFFYFHSVVDCSYRNDKMRISFLSGIVDDVMMILFCLDVTQSRVNGPPNETQTQSCWLASLVC